MQTPFDAQARRVLDAYERLGTSQPCCRGDCNESRPQCLTGSDPDILCYEHRCLQQGRSPVEAHHPAGQHNLGVIVDIPGNDHRILTDMQRDWPVQTLRNPGGSPLLRAAACIRGWADVLVYLVHHTIGWIPPFLEWLDAALSAHIGPRWWVTLGWQGA